MSLVATPPQLALPETGKRSDRQKLAAPHEINGGPFDRFTLVHFASGVVLGRLKLNFWQAAVCSVGWEIIERPLKDHYPQVFPNASQDRMINVVTDALAVMLGWRWGLRK